MSLSDVTIAIPSFCRLGYLAECLKQVKKHLPECPIIVADDSFPHPSVPGDVILIPLDWDRGLTIKRNAIVKAATTLYTLIFCDDFATDENTRNGIEKLVNILDTYSDVDVAGGRVDNRPYEGFLEYVPGSHIKETRLVVPDNPVLFYKVDLLVNYFLARTEVLRQVPWDEQIRPIGGEHGDEFLDLKEAGKTVVFVPGVNVDSLQFGNGPGVQNPNYQHYRNRAVTHGHRIFKEKRNIREYIGFAGDKS